MQYSAPPRHVSASPHGKRRPTPESSQRHPLAVHVHVEAGGRPTQAHDVTKTIPAPHVHSPLLHVGGVSVSPHAPPAVPEAHCAGRPTQPALASLGALTSLAAPESCATLLSFCALASTVTDESRSMLALSRSVRASAGPVSDGAPQAASATSAIERRK